MAVSTVVLLPFCVPGHLTSMLEAGKRLLSRNSHPMSLTVLITQMTMAANLMSEVAEIISREAESGFDIRFHHLPAVELPSDSVGKEDFICRFIQLHAPHTKTAISGLASPVAAVMADYFCTSLFDVIHELDLPVYVYFTSAASMLSLMLRMPEVDEEVTVDFEELDERVVDVPGLPPVPGALMPTPMMRKGPSYAWFVYHGRRMMEAAGIVINTVAELEPGILAACAEGLCTSGRPAPTLFPTGPVLPFKPAGTKPDHECIRWLDTQPSASVILICLGSMGGSFDAPQVREIAEGLERSCQRFLWVLRGQPPAGSIYPIDANLHELLPEGFQERTKEKGLVWPKWAPQRDILAHAAIGGFVTHCGWNSVLESLWHGVPLLAWPLYSEQHLTALELVSVMGVAVGMKVDRKRGNFVEGAELEGALRSLMGETEDGRKVREKTMKAKAMCRRAVEEGGSSYVSLQKLASEVSNHMPKERETAE